MNSLYLYIPMELLNRIICKISTTNDNVQISVTPIFIKLHADFNQEINEFPQYLNYLHLGWQFNQSINKFPQYLLYLYLGIHFNQEIKELPKHLLYLHLGVNFNQEIK